MIHTKTYSETIVYINERNSEVTIENGRIALARTYQHDDTRDNKITCGPVCMET